MDKEALLDLVTEHFEGRKEAPGRGGYGSKIKVKEHPRGVLVELHCQWLPRSEVPQAVVIGAQEGDTPTFQVEGNGSFETAETILEDLADW